MSRLLSLWITGVMFYSETKAGDSGRNLCEVCACDRDIIRVDCSGRRLREIPDGVTAQIKNLNLSNNAFENVPRLQSYVTLQSLDLSWNNLTVLPADAFENLTQLTYLNLSHNSLSSWISINPSLVLLSAKNLETVDLSYNLVKLSYWTEDRLISDRVIQVRFDGSANFRVLSIDSSEVASNETVIYVSLWLTAVLLILSYCIYLVWRVNCIEQKMQERIDIENEIKGFIGIGNRYRIDKTLLNTYE